MNFGRCVLLLLVMVLSLPQVAGASRIAESDCAVNGVTAGWQGRHDLPQKFNGTLIEKYQWKDTHRQFGMYELPQNYIIGQPGILYLRGDRKCGIILAGTRIAQTRQAGSLGDLLFKGDIWQVWAIEFSSNLKNPQEYKTDAGIGVGSTVEQVEAAYGKPDRVLHQSGLLRYLYRIPNRQYPNKYYGAGILISFSQDTKQVVVVMVYNYNGARCPITW